MQHNVDNKTKITQKSDSRSNVQIRKKNEESSRVQTHDYNPLENLTCKIGDSACAAKHVSVIQRAGLFHPMNESQKVQSLLRLQQQYGNRFVQRVIAQHAIQTKLLVGQPGDIYEQEADKVAEQVMHMPETHLQRQVEPEEEEELIQTKPIAGQITPLVQRQIEEEEEEEEEEKEILQTKAHTGQTPKVAPDLESHIHALKGGGQPLPQSVRAFFEPRFGHDFSNVRVHTDNKESETARALNAQAFTVGRDIVFRTGQYATETTAGKQLLAHELTHVVQQNGNYVQSKLKIGKPGDWYDKEADWVAKQVMNIQESEAKFGPNDEYRKRKGINQAKPLFYQITLSVQRKDEQREKKEREEPSSCLKLKKLHEDAEHYINEYNEALQIIIDNMKDAWQDGVNSFESEMNFPSAGEAEPKIAEALLNSAAKELFGFLVGEVGKSYPGVGQAIGVAKSIISAVTEEIDRARKAAYKMALGSFIVLMRTKIGDKLRDLYTEGIFRDEKLCKDFIDNYLGKEGESSRIQFFRSAEKELSKLKCHSQPITLSLAETWIAENFKQESNWLGQLITTGVIELKYEVFNINGMRAYSYQYCKVAMPQWGGRVAKAINKTYAGKSIDLKSFKCHKLIILENRDNLYLSERGILDANNSDIAGTLGAFGLYQNMPEGLRLPVDEKIKE